MVEYVYALHDFTPENPDEVPFKAGEKIEVIEKDDVYQDGWWQGRNVGGQVGLFPQSYTSSRPQTTSQPDHAAPVTFPDASSPPLQPLAEVAELGHQDEASPTDERERTLSKGERTMQATLTDVQRAIEQLGRSDDGTRSFSFASSHGGDTDRSETETEGGDSDDEGGANWHRNARERLALRAQQHNEARQQLEGSVPSTPLRLTAPPIDVELSDESDEESEEHTQHAQKRRSVHTPQYPHIPEEEEETSKTAAVALTVPAPELPVVPSLPSAALVDLQPSVQPTLSVDSENGHIEPSEDFIVPSPSRTDDNNEELPTATAERLTFPEVPKSPGLPKPSSLHASEKNPEDEPLAPSIASSSPPPPPVIAPLPVFSLPATHEYRVPGGLNPLSPISPEEEQEMTPMPPHVTIPSIHATAAPILRAAPSAITTQETIPFLARSTSPGRNSLPSPSVSSTGSAGFSSSAGIQQTLTPATTSMSMKTSGFSIVQQELSPLGSQDGTKAFRTHPSDWTVDEVIDWLRSKGFDQSICDRFIEQEITGDVLLELDANVLKTEFGIAAFGKRARIVNAIHELRRPPSFTDEHPMQALNSRTQSFNYGHSHTSSMQSSAQQSYNNSPMAYMGPGFSPAPSQRGMSASGTLNSAGTGGSLASPDSPMYMPIPEPSRSQAVNGWASSEPQAVLFPSAVGSEATLGAYRADPSPSTTLQPLQPSQTGTGLGLGFLGPRPGSPNAVNGKPKGRPSNLVLSPSDASLRVTAIGDESSATVEERAAMSDSEVVQQPDTKTRRRLFGRSTESASLKEKASSIKDSSSRHSKELSPATPSSGTHGEKGDEVPPMRRHSKKRSSDDRKGSERLSLFGGSLSGTLAKARKPVPRISSSNDEKKPSEHDWGLSALARMRHGDRKASGRPSTSSGEISIREKVQEKPKESEKPTSPVKDKEKRDSAVLRKRTSSTSDIASRSPAFASQIAGGVALKPGKSILEQIGTPDHNGWMRKKKERYNSFKARYFILKGPHLYILRSNDKSETKIKGYINIVGYRVIADEKIDPGRYGFKIMHDSDKPHFFSHEEHAVIREWMKALMKATISRDFSDPVVSSSNIPTIPLTVAQAMTPSPRPPSPTARAATQRAHRRDNPNQLSSRDAQILLMAMPSKDKPTNGTSPTDRPKLDTFFTANSTPINNQEPLSPKMSNGSPKAPPPRPSREIRRTFSSRTASQAEDVVVDSVLIEWANSHLPEPLQITDTTGPICNGLTLLRLAEDIKGSPSSPPVPDSAFPTSPTDERLDGLFRLFDFLLDNDVKMGSVSINDIRQGKRDKIVQLLQALRSWEEKRKTIANSLGMGQTGSVAGVAGTAYMAAPVSYFP